MKQRSNLSIIVIVKVKSDLRKENYKTKKNQKNWKKKEEKTHKAIAFRAGSMFISDDNSFNNITKLLKVTVQ